PLHLSLVFAPAGAAAVAGTSRAMARTAMRARDMGSSGGQRRSRAPRAYPGAPGPGSSSALGFGLALEAVGRAAEQEVAHRALRGPAQQHAQHAPRVDLERVGRPRAPVAEVLEVPPAAQRLHVALLLCPFDARRLRVAEAQARRDGLDLRVVLRVDELGPAVGVARQGLDVLQRALPLRRAFDVGGDGE